jgi:hypothetical protein
MKKEFQVHVTTMLRSQTHLFLVNADKDELWRLYLESFPEDNNRTFRKRREHDCSCCRHFIKRFGNIVAIRDDKFISIWDFESNQEEYNPSLKAMSEYIHKCEITEVFITSNGNLGTDKNHEQLNSSEILTWEHFHFRLPDSFVVHVKEVELNRLRGQFRDDRNVFLRALTEITPEAIETVLELIQQKTLYKGQEWKAILLNLQRLQKESKTFDNVGVWAWERAIVVGPVVSRIRNHSIGVLLQDISKGIDLNDAVSRYEKIVAPSNYKRPKAIFTTKMLQDAQDKIVELGLENSLGRRYAKIEDITVNNILFGNKDTIKKLSNFEQVFDNMAKDTPTKVPNLDRLSIVEIDDFISNIMPKLTNVEILMENRLEQNLVSLIAPIDKNAPTLFKWDNAFSWAYNGNMTDSMKQRVQKAGGNINGVLRFSIMWNEAGDNNNDFDAHAVEPKGDHIFFKNKGRKHPSSGMLDVDITRPFDLHQVPDGGAAVENIVWTDKNHMLEGIYRFYVHNFSHNGGKTGFSAEIEFDGTIHKFHYNRELRNDENIAVAEVILQDNKFTIKPALPSTTASKKLWNISTQHFHPVSTIMYSPNYWNEQKGIGHRHVFFMINDCLNDSNPNGFFNEFLKEDFMEYKRVFEALGSKMHVKEDENQLSGLGFSTTKHDYVVLRIIGSFNRVIKVNF